MRRRTYGWVQNPSDFSKLKRTVQIFDSNSEHYQNLKTNLVQELIPFEEIRTKLLSKLENGTTEFTYLELVGTQRAKDGKRSSSRKTVVADSLIQVSLPSQSATTTGKTWTDNWTSAGYLSWALSLNFLHHDRDTDVCSITETGLDFSNTEEGSSEELELLRQAFLRYPPATQVLRVLSEAQQPVTKFYIGSRLGFKGEKGFTSYREDLMQDWLINSSDIEARKIRQDIEGTSDKYARMIAGWLEKVGFVKSNSSKVITSSGNKRTGFRKYSITGLGQHAFRQAQGNSSNSAVEKYLTWEFLAVGTADSDYIRSRRSLILKSLSKSSSERVLVQTLEEKGYGDDFSVIENDIKGLNTFGLRIEKVESGFDLKDPIVAFSIPEVLKSPGQKNAALRAFKERIMARTDLEPQYYELIDIAYDGNRSRDFEMLTIDILTNVYGFSGKLLGGGRRPDGLVYTEDFGITIDAKAYSKGYGKNISQEDEMVRYIEDNQLRDELRNPTKWWEGFSDSIPVSAYHFLWVSSEFKETFTAQLQSASARTKSTGGALDVEQLLLGADLIQKGKLNLSEVESALCNEVIAWDRGVSLLL